EDHSKFCPHSTPIALLLQIFSHAMNILFIHALAHIYPKCHLEDASKEALALRISQKFALLKEVRPVLETMAYHDKYKKVIDEIWKDKVELDGMIVKEEEEAIKKGVTTLIAKFLILDLPINHDAPIVVGLGFLRMIGGIVNTLKRLFLTFDGFCHQIFRAARSDIRAFNIKEPIYAELCHDFYSTYEFDEVCTDDELQSEKIIKFRLGGRAHNLTLLEFVRRLGLYHADELEEDGFDVYFQGGLHSDDHFNAQEYWLSISREENLGLSRSHASTIRNPILRVIHKTITYGLCQRTIGYDKIQKNDLWLLSMFEARHQNGYANMAWLIARWIKRKGAGTQRESQICCGQFIMKIARKTRVLTDVVLKSLSALIYCRDLDTTTLRELIDSKGRLNPKDPQPGVPRVGIPGPPRASMQDLYDRMGSMEIRQEAIERMKYRQSYQWDRY
ncbi:hypothetical protein Tco_1554498, partial [Tanacetum coccineum]